MKYLLAIMLLINVLGCFAQTSGKVTLVDYESSPQLIGGVDSLYESIEPITSTAMDCGEGKVYVSFILSEDGEISELEVVKGLCHKADSIAKSIVSELKFTPAKYKGEAMRVKRVFPIPFKIKE
jgi:protein TonB